MLNTISFSIIAVTAQTVIVRKLLGRSFVSMFSDPEVLAQLTDKWSVVKLTVLGCFSLVVFTANRTLTECWD